ncbi:hypothetical protein [Flavobacterium sp.]|uniref:hypothetical protein n=1 Tax=Flavobacterium sp. TaxID=239 RepID=UPI0031DEB632
MREANLVLQKLEEIQRYSGFIGVVFAIILISAFLLLWKFLTKSIESNAVIANNKNLEKFKSELQESIGLKITQQQAEINRGLTAYKAELDKDLSKLTSALSLNNSIRIEFKNEERKSIIEFLNSYSEWLYGSLDIQIIDYKYHNFEDINSKLSDINLAYSKTNIALNKMQFWLSNHDLEMSALYLNKKTLELSQFVQSKLGTLRYNLGWGKIFVDSFQEKTSNQANINSTEGHKLYTDFLVKEDKRIRSENEQLIKDFYKGRLEIYGEVLKLNIVFKDAAKKYLLEIAEISKKDQL